MRKTVLGALAATAISIGLLTGCGSSQQAATATTAQTEAAKTEAAQTEAAKTEAAAETTAAQAESKEPIPLRVLAANNGIAHIDSVVAYNTGLYKDEGLDITMNYNPSNPDNIQSLLEDKADLVSAGSTAVLNYIDQGADIVIIGGQMSLGETVYARPERAEEFAKLDEESLAGKKVGVTRMNTGDIAFRKILKDKGVDLSKIEFVELDSQATVTEAVAKGEVDLGINFLTYREVAEAQGLVPVSQLDADDEWPNYICCRMFTTRDKLEANREAYVRALKANIRSYELIQTDHDAALKAATEELPIDEDILDNEIYGYGHLGLSPNPDATNTAAFYQAMVDIGYTGGNVDITNYIDTSVFEDALAELLAEDPDNEIYKELKAESDATNL